jgi:hypothetical protein
MGDSKTGLSYEETEKLKGILGDTASPLNSTVARLLLSDNQGGWINTRKAGALVLLVDRVRECKIIRLYDLKVV